MPTPREILLQNQRDAADLIQKVGLHRARQILLESEREMAVRLMNLDMANSGPFTREQLRTALVQIRHTIASLSINMQKTILGVTDKAAEQATSGIVDYLGRTERQYRGLGSTGLDLDTASMFESAKVGARASVLRRLSSSGENSPGAPQEEHKAKQGILSRYGSSTIGFFESELQKGVIGRKSWGEMKASIIGGSPFLQKAPGHWAERIVRTELMGAYNRAGWEANREADDQLGDMVKILCATFDDRTASDSYAVHGQIRRPDEAFQSWFGLYQHPPNRPNDREIVVPHRISWPLPPTLLQKEDAEILARWTKEKKKGAPPARPKMTTVDLSQFGGTAPPKVKATERRPPRERVPPEE